MSPKHFLHTALLMQRNTNFPLLHLDAAAFLQRDHIPNPHAADFQRNRSGQHISAVNIGDFFQPAAGQQIGDKAMVESSVHVGTQAPGDVVTEIDSAFTIERDDTLVDVVDDRFQLRSLPPLDFLALTSLTASFERPFDRQFGRDQSFCRNALGHGQIVAEPAPDNRIDPRFAQCIESLLDFQQAQVRSEIHACTGTSKSPEAPPRILARPTKPILRIPGWRTG